MIRFVLRFVGFVSLAIAFASLAYDGARSIAGETVYIWHEVLQPYFLKQPVCLVLAIIGAISMWAKEEAADRTRAR